MDGPAEGSSPSAGPKPRGKVGSQWPSTILHSAGLPRNPAAPPVSPDRRRGRLRRPPPGLPPSRAPGPSAACPLLSFPRSHHSPGAVPGASRRRLPPSETPRGSHPHPDQRPRRRPSSGPDGRKESRLAQPGEALRPARPRSWSTASGEAGGTGRRGSSTRRRERVSPRAGPPETPRDAGRRGKERPGEEGRALPRQTPPRMGLPSRAPPAVMPVIPQRGPKLGHE